MVVLNGVIGISLLAGSARHRSLSFNVQGTASALGVLGTLAIIAMILPNYTLADPQRGYSTVQLLFVSGASLILYTVFLISQAVGQREYLDSAVAVRVAHAPAPTRAVIAASILLAVSLAAIVLIADALTPEAQQAVQWAGLPQQFVGVIIAAVVLLPEGSSAFRAARNDRLQTSLNFTLGSAIASTGLTIPAISLLSIFLGWPIELGLEPEHVVLLVLTLFISTLTLSTGRTTLVQGAVHLVIFLVFLVMAAVP